MIFGDVITDPTLIDQFSVRNVILVLGLSILAFIAARITSATRLQKRIDELTSEVFKLGDENRKLKDSSHDCLRREQDLKAELTALMGRVAMLEKKSINGVDLPLSTGVVVADLKGIIRVFSPTLTPMFHWLPEEIVGRPISDLMEEHSTLEHQKMFDRFVADPRRKTDPTRPILGYAKDKTGNQFPVTIYLDSWQVGNEGLITAYVHERAKGSSLPPFVRKLEETKS